METEKTFEVNHHMQQIILLTKAGLMVQQVADKIPLKKRKVERYITQLMDHYCTYDDRCMKTVIIKCMDSGLMRLIEENLAPLYPEIIANMKQQSKIETIEVDGKKVFLVTKG